MLKYGNNYNDNYIISLLKKYNITVFDNLPKGIYSEVGNLGNKISMGMQKIVMVIRGILKNTNIIIFDEPLSSIDKYHRNKIIQLINNECKNKTVLIITHDTEIIPLCNKVIDINKINN